MVTEILSFVGSFFGVLGAYIVAIPDLHQGHRLRFYRNSSRLCPLFETREAIKGEGLGKKFVLSDETVCYTYIDHLYMKGDLSVPTEVPDQIVQQIDRVTLKYDSKEDQLIGSSGLAKQEVVKVLDKALRRRCRTIGIEIAILGILAIAVADLTNSTALELLVEIALIGWVSYQFYSPLNRLRFPFSS